MDFAHGGDAMTVRRALVALLLAAAGYGSFALLFPRYDSSTIWHQQLGRADAILHGQTLIRDVAGLDVSRWPALATPRIDDALRRYLQQPGHTAIPRYLTPVMAYMIFRRPGSDDNVTLALSSEGRPAALFIHRQDPPHAASGPASPAVERDARAALEKFLAGPPVGTLSSAKRDGDGMRFQWSGTLPHAPELTITTDCLIRNGQAVEMRVAYLLAQAQKSSVAFTAVRVTLFLLIQIAAIVMAIFAIVKRRFPPRLLLILLAVVFAAGLAGRIVSPEIDAGSLDKAASYLRARPVNDAVVALGLAILTGTAWAAGHAASRRRFALSTSRLDAVLRGRLLSRSAAASIAIGLMTAGVVAALPYYLAAIHLAGITSVAGSVGGALFDPSYAALFVPPRWLPLMLAFAFVVPLAGDRIRQPTASWLVAAAIGTMVIPGTADRMGSVPGGIVLSVLTFLVYDQLFRRVDLVAVLAAGTAASAVTIAATMRVQPAPSIRSSGSAILLGLAIAAAGFLTRSLTAREKDEEPLEAWSSLEKDAVGERERLLMEISVAREAQQRMLPTAPPAIPGFSVASICRPAHGVGGDLYDFIPLEEGRWGIAVADVSGKGLPAAMYMSMTKGLLLAAVDERSDALEILSDVNAGLYSVGQRNVFVTMFLAVLEPTSREVAFVRAGHNAALWRKQVTGETVSLTPRGIALGMTGSRMFTRSCTVERLVMEPGDTLFIYSDGVTEAMNGDSVEYGDDRLAQAIARADGAGAAAARDLIIEDVSAFVGKTPPNDDLTLVVLQAEPSRQRVV
jgi:serine phosphatase RsbU (regulator of sigma subunit)